MLPAVAFVVPPTMPPRDREALLSVMADEAQNFHPIEQLARMCRGTWRDRANCALASAQSLPFVPDPPGVELFKPVPVTLREGGDCDDLVAYFVALARRAGVRSRPKWRDIDPSLWPVGTAPQNHFTAQVTGDPPSVPDDLARWEWAEPSIPGAVVGDEPLEVARRLGGVRRVVGGA